MKFDNHRGWRPGEAGEMCVWGPRTSEAMYAGIDDPEDEEDLERLLREMYRSADTAESSEGGLGEASSLFTRPGSLSSLQGLQKVSSNCTTPN